MYLYGLCRSSLIMGVHPGCPVYLIVAASLVAVETDVGETIPAAKVAFVCGRSAVGVVELLSVGPSSCFCIHQLLFPLPWGVGSECISTSCGRLKGPPRTQCWCQVLSCLSCRHPCSADVGGLWISFQMPILQWLNEESHLHPTTSVETQLHSMTSVYSHTYTQWHLGRVALPFHDMQGEPY